MNWMKNVPLLLARGNTRLLSNSQSCLLPRAPSTSSEEGTSKWKQFLNRPARDDQSEVMRGTAFGGVRLDSENVSRENDDSLAETNDNDQDVGVDSEFYGVKHEVEEYKETTPLQKGQVVMSPELKLPPTKKKKEPKKPNEIDTSTAKAYKYIQQLRDNSRYERKHLSNDKDSEKVSPLLQIAGGKDSKARNEGRVDPKFLPTDLSKLTSAEVISLLKKSVLYDKDDLVAICKPYGLEMFGADCQHSVEKYLPPLCDFLGCQTLYQVHRLDRITSGILLLAKTQELHRMMAEKFRKREIKKFYWAIVNGTPQPQEGVINIPLREALINDRFRMTVMPDYQKHSNLLKKAKVKTTSSGIKPAVSEYKTLTRKDNRALLEVSPVTGFTHQIRAHLGLGMGTPVLGDHKYSYIKFEGKPQDIHGDILHKLGVRKSRSRDLPTLLHAKRVVIPGVNRDVVIECRLPFYFNRVMKALNLAPR